MKTKNLYARGFTLVELLIVIALIAILSVAVLATIDPIEQTNKARDAKFKNDAAEALSAYERYYASKSEYPWNDSVTFTGVDLIPASIANDTKMVLNSLDPRFGVLDLNGAPNGQLIESSELKSSYGEKTPFVALGMKNQDLFYAYNNGNDSNYVCFCPIAKANRTGSIATTLKCLIPADNNGTLGAKATLVNVGDADGAGHCDQADPNSDFAGGTFCNPGASSQKTVGDFVANLMCVPEGNVN